MGGGEADDIWWQEAIVDVLCWYIIQFVNSVHGGVEPKGLMEVPFVEGSSCGIEDGSESPLDECILLRRVSESSSKICCLILQRVDELVIFGVLWPHRNDNASSVFPFLPGVLSFGG